MLTRQSFPLSLQSAPSFAAPGRRFYLLDVLGNRLCTLFDVDPESAHQMLDILNTFGVKLNEIETLSSNSGPDADLNQWATAHSLDMKPIRWPEWMDENPRFGAVWGPREKAKLKEAWLHGIKVPILMQIFGRDASGINGQLVRHFGANYHQFFNQSNRLKVKSDLEKLVDQLAGIVVKL